MRDILDKLELLTEATGLAGRKPGNVFRDQEGDELAFDDLVIIPQKGGKLSPEQLDKVVQQQEMDPTPVYWQNSRTARSGAVSFATFTPLKDGTPLTSDPIIIGRYLEQAKPSITDNYIPNSFTTGERVWKFGGNASKAGEASKTDSKLSPQDLLGEPYDLEVQDIMTQLAMSLGTDNPLYAVAHRIAIGEPLPMTFPAPEGYNFAAFRDYFCEILQPMALQKGQYTGNAGDAAKRFLGGSFEDTLISFDASKTAGLSDSVLTTSDGRFVKVSTKGGKGATASVKNLGDSVEELRGTPEGNKLLKKHKETLDLLATIQGAGQYNAPLFLAVEYGIITRDEANKIEKLRDSQLTNLKNVGALGLSKKLQKMALERNTANPNKVNLFYHLTAAVAHKVAEYVNKHTSFSKGATEILNNGALVQVYTKASEGKDTWKLGEFNTVYPGTSIKGVLLDAGKNYYSNAVKGNFTFKIDKGAGVENDNGKTEDFSTADSSEDFQAGAEEIANGKKRKERPKNPDAGKMRTLRKK